MVAKPVVYLDFDGTLTDIEKSTVDFVEAYKADVRAELQFQDINFDDVWKAAEIKIGILPAEYGWEHDDGRISAPAFSDPFLWTQTVAQEVYKEREVPYAVRRELFFRHFSDNVGTVKVVPRKGLDDLLGFLRDSEDYDAAIITNSGTHKVEDALASWGYSGVFQVFGDAKKYNLSKGEKDNFNILNGRNVYLDRPDYLRTLESASSFFGKNDVSRDIFVGDIFDFDLALPISLGAKAVYLPGSRVPADEREEVGNYFTDEILAELKDVVEVLGEM